MSLTVLNSFISCGDVDAKFVQIGLLLFCFSQESKKKANIQEKAILKTSHKIAHSSYKQCPQNVVILKCRINDTAFWGSWAQESMFMSSGGSQRIFMLVLAHYL